MKQKFLRNSLLIAFYMMMVSSVFAQNEATTYFMNSLPQVTYLNPASVPRYRFSLGFPGSSVFLQYANNGFAYNDLVKKEGTIIEADLNKFFNAMADKNYINTAAQVDIFRFSMKVNARMYLTVSSIAKIDNRFMLPRDVAGIFINGTLPYVNSTASLSPQLQSVAYVENGAGASYIVNRKLTVGAKLKFLKGAANITTNNSKFDLSLDQDYAITISGAADVKSSGFHSLADSSSYEPEDNWRDFLGNNGFALDLGFTYKVNDKLMLGLSAIDIGGIRWKNDVYGYQLDPAKATYTYRGVDLEEALNGNIDVDAILDTLEQNFKLTEGKIASYRTPLPAKIYISGTYRLARNFNAGVLLFAEKSGSRFSPGFSANLCKDFGRRLTTSLSYTISNRSFNNLGAGMALNFAPIQIYVVGDNILRAPLALLAGNTLNDYVNSMKYFNVRVGLNFVFGWDKTQERQPYPGKIR